MHFKRKIVTKTGQPPDPIKYPNGRGGLLKIYTSEEKLYLPEKSSGILLTNITMLGKDLTPYSLEFKIKFKRIL